MKSERQRAVDRADQWASRYTRLKNSSNGVCICYTCGNPKEITELDTGHYIGRGHYATRWDENNLKPQCKKCNMYRHGEPAKFRARLLVDLGKEKLEEMEFKGMQTIKYSTEEIREIAKEYREKANELAKTKGKFW